MHPLLTRLDDWLASNRPEYHAGLRPGAADSAIDEIARRIDGELPPLLRSLLVWHDGHVDTNTACLESYWCPMSAEGIVDTLDMIADMVEYEDFADEWGIDWVPFLENQFGDYVCIDLHGAFDGTPGQIVEFHHDGDYRTITFPSLQAWLETLVTALESGMYEVEEDGRPQVVDDAAYEALVADRHPGYPIDIQLADYASDERESDAAKVSHITNHIAHAVDLDRLRTTLRDLGQGSAVLDSAFGITASTRPTS
ncbi:SMI1/KNR4 family protein [Nocardia sp. NPDC058658]|uniref:SMI1/KNR4 family protein n=1 Tax=Nocardia sp. NPDC058658 TaxID=3346580 RepID=UPI0036572543